MSRWRWWRVPSLSQCCSPARRWCSPDARTHPGDRVAQTHRGSGICSPGCCRRCTIRKPLAPIEARRLVAALLRAVVLVPVTLASSAASHALSDGWGASSAVTVGDRRRCGVGIHTVSEALAHHHYWYKRHQQTRSHDAKLCGGTGGVPRAKNCGCCVVALVWCTWCCRCCWNVFGALLCTAALTCAVPIRSAVLQKL